MLCTVRNSSFSCFRLVNVVIVLLTLIFSKEIVQIECLNFSYPTFNSFNRDAFNFSYGSDIFLNAIQVTRDVRADILYNTSGRALYGTKFKLWSDKKNKTSSFNSTFVMNITPQTKPGGEGLTFILTKDDILPENSEGQWLGLVNTSSNGSLLTQTVGIEFDTKKSYVQDLDGDHVGVDINSINSIQQVSLLNHGVNISSGTDVTAMILYDGDSKKLDVYVFMTKNNNTIEENTKNPIISMTLALNEYLPEDVFIGFSASTGISTQLNCVRAWYFTSTHIIEENPISRLWLWITISLIIILLCGIAYYIYRCNKAKRVQRERENKKEKYPGIEQELQISTTYSSPQKYQLKQLIAATDNFNEKNKLGEGGFGSVYKGLLDSNEVAVKRVSQHSKQGKQEFLSEVTTISNLHHKNLVKLIGWCYEKNELLLVYEFMPNGSLEKHIFFDKDSNSSTTLNWVQRVGIIHGVAQALDYLHNGCEKRVLHRDIKLSNIMLDSDFNAKLGDFGLARTLKLTEKTHHSTKEIAGTPGYIAPEFFHTGRASTEIDIYAFGILLLETLCGKTPTNHLSNENVYVNGIVEMVWEFYQNERITDVIDERVDGEYEPEDAECVLMLGLSCCHPNPNERPSMRSVLQVLIGEAYPPELPFEKPAFMWPANSPAALSFSIDGSSVSGTKLSLFSQISGR